MESFHDILQRTFLGNTLESYLWFFGILLAGLLFRKVVSKIFSWLLYHLIRRYGKIVGAEKLFSLLGKPFSIFVVLITFYLAFDRLAFPEGWHLVPEDRFGFRMIVLRIFNAAIILTVTWIILRMVDFMGLILMQRALKSDSKLDDQLVPFAKEGVKVILACIGFVMMLGIGFRLNVVSLITGLGIGGLAFALAAKETVENLLGSFTIFLDKPFTVGDSVKVGAYEGTVESIGFRSTRIRTVEKTLLFVPNKKMVDAELDNQTERVVNRAKFTISLTNHSGAEQMKAVTHDLQKMLHQHPMIEKNSVVRFLDITSVSLDILIIYFVKTPEWGKFAEVKEEVNYNLMDIVKKHGCEFARPFTTIRMETEKQHS
jgi:MscS family membrane protein